MHILFTLIRKLFTFVCIICFKFILMKKIIALVTLSLFFVSCSNDSNNSNNNNPSNGNVNYFFKIKINGVEHKVQGNTSTLPPNYSLESNKCSASIGTTTILNFTIEDITRPNFVSGQNLRLTIFIPNCHVGQNQADIFVSHSPVWSNFISNSNVNGSFFVENSGLYCGQSFGCQYPLVQSFSNKITLNVTDMGTPTVLNPSNPNWPYEFGNTFKGNYNGTLYYGQNSTNNGIQIWNMNTPMQFSMEFEAYRGN